MEIFFDFHASVRKFSRNPQKNLVTTKNFLVETRNSEKKLVSNKKKTLLLCMGGIQYEYPASLHCGLV